MAPSRARPCQTEDWGWVDDRALLHGTSKDSILSGKLHEPPGRCQTSKRILDFDVSDSGRALRRTTTSFESTITGIPLALDSELVAIEAITRGSVVESDPDTYASRWRSVRGIPLVWMRPERSERIIVGAATLTTTTPAGDSIFDEAEGRAPGIRKTIDIDLHAQLVRFWD